MVYEKIKKEIFKELGMEELKKKRLIPGMRSTMSNIFS